MGYTRQNFVFMNWEETVPIGGSIWHIPTALLDSAYVHSWFSSCMRLDPVHRQTAAGNLGVLSGLKM